MRTWHTPYGWAKGAGGEWTRLGLSFRLRALTDRGGSYYYCRRDVANDHQCKCAHRGVREGRLLPWAGLLFERVDALRPEDFDRAVAAASRRGASPDAIAQVERSIDRQGKLFTWGHIAEADYLRE